MSGSKRLFGTDGIRGIANKFPMTPEIALRLGKSLAYTISKIYGKPRPKIILGKDTRLSGYIFEQAITAGLISMGADVYLVGPLPTPAIAFLTRNMRADAGIVISASHNPYTDNGIKIFDKHGFKLPDKKERMIEELILDEVSEILDGTEEKIGKANRIEDATGRYVVFIKKTFPTGMTLDGMKIVLDCANGAAYKVGPLVFSELGADVISIGVEPDGKNINTDCGSLNPELLIKNVLKNKADIGIALDGDADRVIFCDNSGKIVDGDKILAICAEEMLERGQLKKKEIVATLMSNMGLELYLDGLGVKLHRTNVGDRYVVEEMKEKDINLGGEQSGHIIFLDYTTTGDGLLASMQVLAIMKRLNKSLSELVNNIVLFPQVLKNIEINDKKPLDEIPGLSQMIDGYENELGKKGRINIRYSGTEQLARIMVEGEDKENIDSIADDISVFLQQQIGN